MRILVAGPPKSGNVWIENLLAAIYDLDILRSAQIPAGVLPFKRFIAAGGFRDSSIFHQHFWPTDAFFEVLASTPCHLVTILRDPYDTFVSLYYYIQNFSQQFEDADEAATVIGKPIDHPDVLTFLAHGFRQQLELAQQWLESGKSLILRYEGLHANPVHTVRSITDPIQPVEEGVIREALQSCEAARMRKRGKWMARHVRSATVGDWRNHLGEAHLEILRDCHGDLITRLGYAIREVDA